AFGELRRRGVARRVDPGDLLTADERRRTEAQDQGEQVEDPDEADAPHDGLAGVAGRRDGVEADQDVRQSRGAEDEREPEADQVDLAGEALLLGAVAQPRLQERLALAAL